MKPVRTYQHKCFVINIYDIEAGAKPKRGVKWFKNSTVYGELFFIPEVHEENNQPRLLASGQSTTVGKLYRMLFARAWEVLYDFATFFSDVEFQKTYLNNRIKKHSKWVDQDADRFAENGCDKVKKRLVYNSSTLRKLQKRLSLLA